MFSRLKPTLVTAPAAPLVSLADAKAQLRVDHDDEDTLIAGLVAAAEGHLDGADGVLRRALVTQTWEESFPHFAYSMFLKLGPVQSITSVKYYDADNAEQTVSASVYNLYETPGKAYVQQASGQSWPAQTYSRDDAVTIRYVCGYGAAADVPDAIVHAAKLLLSHYYEHRTAVTAGAIPAVLPLGVAALTAPYRRHWTYSGAS